MALYVLMVVESRAMKVLVLLYGGVVLEVLMVGWVLDGAGTRDNLGICGLRVSDALGGCGFGGSDERIGDVVGDICSRDSNG